VFFRRHSEAGRHQQKYEKGARRHLFAELSDFHNQLLSAGATAQPDSGLFAPRLNNWSGPGVET
jgi:hypothetical protein